MARFFHPLIMVLARATESELARYVEYLKAENRILRDKLPKRIVCTPAERQRLVKLGKPLGSAIKDLITIVTPRSFARWASAADKTRKEKKKTRKPGRPRTPEAIRELVIQMAKDNGWGLGRILGELKKLGIRSVSKSTSRGGRLSRGNARRKRRTRRFATTGAAEPVALIFGHGRRDFRQLPNLMASWHGDAGCSAEATNSVAPSQAALRARESLPTARG